MDGMMCCLNRSGAKPKAKKAKSKAGAKEDDGQTMEEKAKRKNELQNIKKYVLKRIMSTMSALSQQKKIYQRLVV